MRQICVLWQLITICHTTCFCGSGICTPLVVKAGLCGIYAVGLAAPERLPSPNRGEAEWRGNDVRKIPPPEIRTCWSDSPQLIVSLVPHFLSRILWVACIRVLLLSMSFIGQPLCPITSCIHFSGFRSPINYIENRFQESRYSNPLYPSIKTIHELRCC